MCWYILCKNSARIRSNGTIWSQYISSSTFNMPLLDLPLRPIRTLHESTWMRTVHSYPFVFLPSPSLCFVSIFGPTITLPRVWMWALTLAETREKGPLGKWRGPKASLDGALERTFWSTITTLGRRVDSIWMDSHKNTTLLWLSKNYKTTET